MSLLNKIRDDDDDGVSRREMLAIGGASAFAVGILTADSEDGALMPASGGGVATGTFGDWEVAILDDWTAYEPDRFPAIALHTTDNELRLFEASVSLPTRTNGETMNAIITDDLSSTEINQTPALVFDTGGEENQMRLYEAGDI